MVVPIFAQSLTMEEIMGKFIDEGKREYKEMETFIKEFRLTKELLLKEHNNLLSEFRIEVHGLSRVMNDVLILKNKVKGVTTRGGRMMVGIAYNDEINNINKESSELLHDKPKEPRDVILQNKPQKTKETISRPLVKIEAIVQMPKYAKFLKSLLTNKSRLEEACMIMMNERCLVVLLNKLPSKEEDPGIFTIPCYIGDFHINNVLADLGASISFMPYTMYENLGLGEPKPTRMSLELSDRSIQHPQGIVENVLIKFYKIFFAIDSVILDMPKDSRILIILGRPFLATTRAMIDVFNKKITLKDAKPRLIRWVLLLQRFNIEIKHKKGAVNLAADYLSRLENPNMKVLIRRETADEFPDEHLMMLKAKLNDGKPWSVDYINYIIGKVVPTKWLCIDNVMRRCVARSEILKILAHYHSGPTGGNHSASINEIKVEAQALPINDGHVVVKFLRGLFARFGVPKALISDLGTHFCNFQLEKALQKYSVTHKLSTAYHPQSNRQTKVTNKAIKRILERSVGYNPKDWSKNLTLHYGHLGLLTKHRHALKQSNMDLTGAAKNCFIELNELTELKDGAYENARIYKERTKRWHNSRLQGDKDFKTTDKNGFSFKVSGKRLKKYFEGNIDNEEKEVVEIAESVFPDFQYGISNLNGYDVLVIKTLSSPLFFAFKHYCQNISMTYS
nr:hypothetical protein [Tanacetum cinerariifolium]